MSNLQTAGVKYCRNKFVLQTTIKLKTTRVNSLSSYDLDTYITNLLETNGLEVETIIVNQAHTKSHLTKVFASKNNIGGTTQR